MRSRVLRSRGLLLSTILAALPLDALADVVRLHTGEEHVGTIANLDDVMQRADKGTLSTVSILVGDGPDATLRRYDASEIEFILIETTGGPLVYDFGSPVSDPPPVTNVEPTRRSQAGGAVAVVLGAAALTIGIFHKFGPPDVPPGGVPAYYDETYDVTNYILMVGGGLLVLAGAVTLAHDEPQPAQGAGFRVGYRFRF